MENKKKTIYYKEIISHKLEDQNYLSSVSNIKNKINIAKIRTNSHALHSDMVC
jgi:hypothetical protein